MSRDKRSARFATQTHLHLTCALAADEDVVENF